MWCHTCWGSPAAQRVASRDQSYKAALPYFDQLDVDVHHGRRRVQRGMDFEHIGKMISKDKKIALGVISHRTLQVERPEEIAELIRLALKHIEPERLILTSDCGFGRQSMSRMHAFYKMVALVRGTNIVRKELGLPEALYSRRPTRSSRWCRCPIAERVAECLWLSRNRHGELRPPPHARASRSRSEPPRGKVDAARFVVGTLQEVIVGHAPVRKAPSHDAPLLTEALRGERVTVYEIDDEGWAWGQLAHDGYVGWLPAAALLAPRAEPTHRVAALRTLVFPAADDQAAAARRAAARRARLGHADAAAVRGASRRLYAGAPPPRS